MGFSFLLNVIPLPSFVPSFPLALSSRLLKCLFHLRGDKARCCHTEYFALIPIVLAKLFLSFFTFRILSLLLYGLRKEMA